MASTDSKKRPINEGDISTLKDLLKSTDAEVLSPNNAAYKKSIERWSSAAEKPAGLAIVPTSADQISKAIKYASSQNIDVAVRGGGHSTAGVSSTKGGLLVDLRGMRNVTVDPSKKTLHVQGGAIWADVDEASGKHGLATVGGTVADTGVGGLTLGGGYGWLSGEHGLVIDNLLSCTVVLANGDIVTATRTENTDLFWALCGAGQNFGVATEFVFQAYEQGDMWAGMLVFPPTPEVVQKVVDATNLIFAAKNGKTKLAGKGMGGISIGRPPPAGGGIVIAVPIIYNGSEEEGKEAFKTFYDIGPIMSTMQMVPYAIANKTLTTPYGMRVSMKGASFKMPLRTEYVQEVLESFTEFTEKNEDAKGSMILWELYDPHQVVARASNEDMSFANRGWHLNCMIAPFWTDPKFDAEGRQWARDVTEICKKELSRAGEETSNGIDGGVGLRGEHGAVLLYGNYDQYDEKSRDIFGANYPRLQKLKAKYDPGNTFNKLFAITPQAQPSL